MFCKNCGTPLKDNVKFCHNCGTAIEIIEIAEVVEPIEATEPVEVLEPVEVAEPIEVIQHTPIEPQPIKYIPPEYQPLGAWSFFWLRILFAIPVVGFVFLIIFSFSRGNLSRRSFARSYWCGLLICAIATAAILTIYLIVMIAGVGTLGYMYY